jgi:hypothetical protein
MIASFVYSQSNSYIITTITHTDGTVHTVVRPKGK